MRFRIDSFKYNLHAPAMVITFNPYLTLDFPIIINWVSPLSFLGVLGVIFNFYLIFR